MNKRQLEDRTDEETKLRRPHHRPIILTVSREDYDLLKSSGIGIRVRACNDLVRTSRCGAENEHHWERRVDTLICAARGGYHTVDVRSSGDDEHLKCIVYYIDMDEQRRDLPYLTVEMYRAK